MTGTDKPPLGNPLIGSSLLTSGAMPVLEPGHVWLVGAGPGDPSLLTLSALALLAQADEVVHDALIDPRVLDLTPPETSHRFAGKRGGKPSTAQDDISSTLIELAKAGRKVVRLKGGDPFIFGRGGEECVALAEAGIPYHVVPGISSGLAGLAAAHIPTTMRGINQGFVLVTGHGAGQPKGHFDWRGAGSLNVPVIVYMGVKNIAFIASELVAGGMPANMPAAILSNVSMENQGVIITTASEVAGAAEAKGVTSPSIFVFGEIVSMRARLLGLLAEAGISVTGPAEW
ncbi:uroporphyrinogen-III C-methyltransferase [Radicibacter daui]|uniref:uroporphyrinogen-III C-methyltransferase n=1 Tax=Radicibacter daui TaxID=3064829 RepID=UPI004046F3F3